MGRNFKTALFGAAAAGVIGISAAAWSARPDQNAEQAETFRQLGIVRRRPGERVHSDYVEQT
jgi:hypothetical protein